jgi:hypothetical protein
MKAKKSTPEGVAAQLPPNPLPEIKSQKLVQLIEQVEASAKQRGHQPEIGEVIYSDLHRSVDGQTAVVACSVCRREAYVITHPIPYEAEVSGQMVTVGCVEGEQPVQLWHEISEDHYEYMLGVVPPIFFNDTKQRGWLCSEPECHSGQGHPQYAGFTEFEDKFYQTNGPVTRGAFRYLLNEFSLLGYTSEQTGGLSHE